MNCLFEPLKDKTAGKLRPDTSKFFHFGFISMRSLPIYYVCVGN